MPNNHKGEASVRRPTPRLRLTALFLVGFTLIFAPSRLARAKTINANSASQSDVSAAIRSAADNDTVIIPSGTATWTHTLVVRKAITLQGAGVGSTIIKDAVQNTQLIRWSLPAGQPSRMTGIEFQDGGRVNIGTAPGGIIRIDGSNTNGSTFRMDHCKWLNLWGYFVTDTVIGVLDHNEIVVGGRTGEWLYPYGMRWNGGDYGDGSWAVPANYGSSQFLFLEDNSIISVGNGLSQIIDVFGGGRVVMRHNTLFGVITGNHGTESTGRVRSGRAMDIYANSINCDNRNKFVGGNRGGSELFHNNTITNCGGTLAQHALGSYRMIFPFPVWGGADGTNVWDHNSGPFFSGTASSVGTLTVTTTGANWSLNQWAGYTIKRTAGGTPGFAYINGNSSNTINFSATGGFGANLSFSLGDAFTISKVEQTIDQPGIGAGPLLRGNPPPRPQNWDQSVEPCYMWGNTNDGQPFNSFTSLYSNIKAGVNYFNNTPMPGYTPYTYPHPLTKGLPLQELMTRNVTGNSQHNTVKKRRPWGGKKLDGKKAKKAKARPTNEMADGPESLGH
jgi:hypothetical protein